MDPNSQKLLMVASGKKKPYVGDIAFAQTSASSKRLKVFEFEAGVGYGAELVGINLTTTGDTVAFNQTRDALAVGYSGKLTVYRYTPGVGLGTSSSVAGDPHCIAFSNSGSNLAVADAFTPYILVYPWTSAGGLGTPFSNPSTLPTGIGRGIAFTPSDAAIAIAHDAAPRISIYPWSNSTGFGAKYANPSTALASNGRSVVFNNAGNVVFVSVASSPHILAYAWSDSTGFGAKFSDPSSLPGSPSLQRLALTPTDDALFMAATLPTAYEWNNSTGFGAKYANPASRTASSTSVAITPNGDTVFFTNSSSGSQDLRAAAYPWNSATGFGARYTGVNHEGQPNDVAVLPI